jgi:hypothetical protein
MLSSPPNLPSSLLKQNPSQEKTRRTRHLVDSLSCTLDTPGATIYTCLPPPRILSRNSSIKTPSVFPSSPTPATTSTVAQCLSLFSQSPTLAFTFCQATSPLIPSSFSPAAGWTSSTAVSLNFSPALQEIAKDLPYAGPIRLSLKILQ